jgi:hypothetical protein
MPASFQHPIAKLVIGSLDDPNLEVTAQYNPSQLEIGRSVEWKHVNPDNTPDTEREESIGRDVEYTGGQGRTVSFELLLDGVEENRSIDGAVEALDRMSRPRNASSKVEELRRPHQCVIAWGDRGIKPMRCVIESITTKYTVFDGYGKPMRATVSVKVREATMTKYDAKAFSKYGDDMAKRQIAIEEKRRRADEEARSGKR